MITFAGIDAAEEPIDPADLFEYFGVPLRTKPSTESPLFSSHLDNLSLSAGQESSIHRISSQNLMGDQVHHQLKLPLLNENMGEVVLFRPKYAGILNLYTLDELTPVIGFKCGALALHRAGFERIGDILRSTPSILATVPNIGDKKIAQIVEYFRGHSINFGDPPVPKRGQHLSLCNG